MDWDSTWFLEQVFELVLWLVFGPAVLDEAHRFPLDRLQDMSNIGAIL